MKTVWKTTTYLGDPTSDVSLPAGARPLSCMVPDAVPQTSTPRLDVWWLVDTSESLETRKVIVAMTGKPLADRTESLEFVGTVAVDDLRFHVWA